MVVIGFSASTMPVAPERDVRHTQLIELTKGNAKSSPVGVSHLSYFLVFSTCIKRICM